MRDWFARLFGEGDVAVHLGPGRSEVWGLDGRAFELALPPPRRTFPPEPAPRNGLVLAAEATVRALQARLRRRRLVRRVLACTRADAITGERTEIVRAFERAGAREVLVVPESLAAAVGAGLDVSSPYAQLLVDVGETGTEGAVVVGNGVVAGFSVPLGRAQLRTALRRHLLAHHALRLDDADTDALVLQIGAHRPERGGAYVRVTGRDLSERAKVVWLGIREAHGVLEPVLAPLLDGVRSGIASLPAELGAEVIESGICLTGGGAPMRGLAERLGEATGLDVRLPAEPGLAVMRGAQRMLDALVRGAGGLGVLSDSRRRARRT